MRIPIFENHWSFFTIIKAWACVILYTNYMLKCINCIVRLVAPPLDGQPGFKNGLT